MKISYTFVSTNDQIPFWHLFEMLDCWKERKKIPHLPKFRHFCMNKERIPFIAIEQKSVSQALCNMLNITVRLHWNEEVILWSRTLPLSFNRNIRGTEWFYIAWLISFILIEKVVSSVNFRQIFKFLPHLGVDISRNFYFNYEFLYPLLKNCFWDLLTFIKVHVNRTTGLYFFS